MANAACITQKPGKILLSNRFEVRVMGAVAVVSDFQSAEEAEFIDDLGSKSSSQVEGAKLLELFESYARDMEGLKQMAAVMSAPDARSVVKYFEHASYCERVGYSRVDMSIFDYDAGKSALDALHWERALNMTNLLELMPQNRRSEWDDTIRQRKTPEFTREAVLSTLRDFQSNTFKYFAERVDGVFRALSGDHVTNVPQGFSKRLIIAQAIDSLDLVSTEKSGFVYDLRCVVARVLGLEEPNDYLGSPVIKGLRSHYGKWMPVDGGCMRFKLFQNGNLHIEVGPDLAWKLNAVLATLYPMAIPSQFRSKPKKLPPEFARYTTPLPPAVLHRLHEMRYGNRHGDEREAFTSCQHVLTYDSTYKLSSDISKQVEAAISAMGGVTRRRNAFTWFEFPYDPRPAISDVMVSGCIPDQVSHQFYPTKEFLARMAVDYAGIQPGDEVCEPEAGLGGIAQYIPADQLTCIEVSPLHCTVLEAQGFKTINADYLKWAENQPGPQFDRIISNPPFSKGRAVLHMQASATMLRPGGRLVAILPASMHGKNLFGEGWSVAWEGPFEDCFDGTGVVVSLMIADLDEERAEQ
ncbi:DUF4942 domain-containing protein [Pseudomonas aeruginosa]